jgi:hypothetical protein
LPPPQSAEPDRGLRRWFDLQAGTVSGRYRTIENSEGIRTANQLQYSGQFRGRFKFDPQAKLTLNANYATGNNFIGSWNNAGIGTGDFTGRWYVKQLYAAWVPVRGLDLTYGSMGFARGSATEITTYDNDGYMMGERISVKRASQLFFDELTASRGYIGDLATPGVFDRFDRLVGGRNYYQLLVSKTVGSVSASADYSRLSDVPYVRLAAALKTPALHVADTIRVEHYFRFGADEGTGFGVFGEKVINKRVTLGVGYADIDPRYLPVNADRFAQGKRLYETATVTLTQELTAQAFLTQAINNDFRIANRQRIDLVLVYNVLGTMRRANWFR